MASSAESSSELLQRAGQGDQHALGDLFAQYRARLRRMVGTWREAFRSEEGWGFAFSPDNRLLALGDVFNEIRLVEISSKREVARLTGSEQRWYYPACFTPDGTRLVATDPGSQALYV